MMTVCAASRRLTLANTIQGIYRAEVARQRLENSAINRYHRYQRQPFTPVTVQNVSLPQRPFSTSITRASEEGNVSLHGATRTEPSESDVLAELTSTNPDDTQSFIPKKKNSKSNSPKASSKSNEKKRIKGKKVDTTLPSHTANPPKKVKLEPWKVQKQALKEKFQEGWFPRKKLSPDTLDTIRHLHATKPNEWTTPVLANQFKVSPEAIRRILKSRWQPSEEERQKRKERWHKRHERLWSHMEQLGLRPKRGERTAKFSDARKLGIESAPSSPLE